MKYELISEVVESQRKILRQHHELRQSQVNNAIQKLHLTPSDAAATLRFMFPSASDNLTYLTPFEARAVHQVFSSSDVGVTNSYTRVGALLDRDRRTISRAVRKALDKATQGLGISIKSP